MFLMSCSGSPVEFSEPAPAPAPTPAPAAAAQAAAPAATAASTPTRYALEGAEVEIVGVEGGLVVAEFSVAIRNHGDGAGPGPFPVELSYGGTTETVHTVGSLPPGEVTRFTFRRQFQPDDYQVSVRVVDLASLVDVDARVVDINLEALGYQVVGNRVATLEVEVTNRGGLLADFVVLSTEWSPDPGVPEPTGSPGVLERAAVMTLLAPEETRVVTVPLYPVTGAYTVTVHAETGPIEIVEDNNTAVTEIALDYVQLSINPEFIRHRGYQPDGKGIVDVGLLVRNDGVKASGDLNVGLVCRNGSPGSCSEAITIPSIEPGESYFAVARAVVEQGETEVLAYAGTPEDDYRWGDGNVAELTVDVPERAAQHLVLDTNYQVAGYWSDGTANVEITAHLRNEGYRPATGVQPVAVSCPQNGGVADFCRRQLLVELADGFSPESESFMLRMPAGMWELELDYGGAGVASQRVGVPERIVGVDRAVWECFSDRPGLVLQRQPGDFTGGCASWGSETMQKWSREAPITVWATGREDYVGPLEEALEELSPMLSLEIRWVDSKDEADIQAYLGLPASASREIGFSPFCADTLGCAKIETDYQGGMRSAAIAVWLNEDRSLVEMGVAYQAIRRTILHETLHALLPILHRDHPSSIMNVHNALRLPYISPMDEALFRLHSHPLVKPGMTIAEVGGLIVFADEMLDSPPPAPEPGALEVVRQAFVALQQAGSAAFRVSGGWAGRGCGGHAFGVGDPAQYEIADFGPTRANLVHLSDSHDRFVVVDSEDPEISPEFWRESSAGWERVDVDRLENTTAWRRAFSSPHRMLASILFFADAQDVEVSEGQDGTLTLRANLDEAYSALEWSREEALEAVLVVDSESYQIRQYRMDWEFTPLDRDSCTGYRVEARRGRYGIHLGVPEAVFEGSKIVR